MRQSTSGAFLPGLENQSHGDGPAAVANAITNATGVRVRNDPVTLDKPIDRLPLV